MVLRSFERRLEQLVEGSFARAFRSSVEPVELGRRLVRRMDEERRLGVGGTRVHPNSFVIRLSADDFDRFREMSRAVAIELEALARDHSRAQSTETVGAMSVRLAQDPSIRPGRFVIDALHDESTGAGGALVFADGTRLAIGDRLVIGRLPECDVAIDDPAVSRRHAEIVRTPTLTVVDLDSTNGTRVDGVSVSRHELRDGETVEVAGRPMMFEAR